VVTDRQRGGDEINVGGGIAGLARCSCAASSGILLFRGVVRRRRPCEVRWRRDEVGGGRRDRAAVFGQREKEPTWGIAEQEVERSHGGVKTEKVKKNGPRRGGQSHERAKPRERMFLRTFVLLFILFKSRDKKLTGNPLEKSAQTTPTKLDLFR
jgi:hypothetical protein